MSSPIIHYKVEISDSTGKIDKNVSEFKRRIYRTIGENERYLCINDEYFSTICKMQPPNDGFKLYPHLDDASLSIYAADRFWGNRITYSLYSTIEVPASVIRAAIKKAVKKTLGMFLDGVDLSFIKDGAA